jgi:hypothetical protein
VSHIALFTISFTISFTILSVDRDGNIREYTDGLWHTFNIYVNKTNINTTVDGYSRFTNKDMDIPSSPLEFLFGKK